MVCNTVMSMQVVCRVSQRCSVNNKNSECGKCKMMVG